MTIINPKSIAGVTSITTPSGSDNLFTVHTNNTTERIRINNDGDVIVGSGITVSPDGDIFTTGVTTATTFVGALTGNVTGTLQTAAQTNITSLGTLTSATISGDLTIADSIVHSGDTDTKIRFPSANQFTVETAGTERLKLDRSSDQSHLYVIGDDTGLGARLFLQNKNTTSGAQSSVECLDQGGQAVSGIKFHITDHSNNEGFISMFTRPSGGSTTEAIRIDSSGRMSLGTTDASQFNAGADDFVIQGSGSCGITIDATSSTNSNIYFADGPTGSEAYRGYVQYQHATDKLILGASGADQVEITSGNVEITDGDLVIGTSGHGISFAITANTTATGGSTSNELFDDYEEGTWTPIIAYQYGSVTSYNSQIGKYTKIGNMVYADFFIALSNKGDPSGSYSYIMNLPYNHTGSTAGTGTINYFNNMGTNYSFLAYEIGGSSPTVAWLTGVVGTQATSMSYIGGGNFTNNSYLSGTLIYRVSG